MIVLPVLLITVLMNATPLLGFKRTGRSVPPSVCWSLPSWVPLMTGRDCVGAEVKGCGRARSSSSRLIALVAAIGLYYYLDVPHMYWPGEKGEIGLGIWYIPIAVFWIVGMSNAVNFTDGLDGGRV